MNVSSFYVLWESALQRHVPAQLLGRVVAIDWLGSLLFGPASPIVIGSLIMNYGSTAVFVFGGSLVFVVALLGLLHPSIRHLE